MRRRLWFRILAIAFGLSLVGACELVLRQFDWGAPQTAGDPFVGFAEIHPLFDLNPETQRYEIPVNRQNFFQPDSFPATKRERTFRIFVFGGSTVQGRPYAIETSFTTWLELNLRALAPDRDWQVVNCGGVSYASYRLLPILRETLAYEPDMFIVYTGHNEFLEARSYAQTKRLASTGGPVFKALANSRLYALSSQACNQLLTSSQPKPQLAAEVDALLDYRGGLAKYHRDDPWRDQVIQHFEYNLQRMIAVSDANDIPLVLVNPVANLRDSPPFKMECSSDLSAAELEQVKTTWERSKALPAAQTEQAVELLRAALAIDSRHPGLWFHLAKCLDRSGQHELAKQAYLRAKDEDICPLRVMESQAAAMRRVAHATKTPWIDARAEFARLSPQTIVGKELMIDHVHPTIRGHQLIAELLVDELIRLGTLSAQTNWRETQRADYKHHLAQLDATYFERGRERLAGLRRWSEGRALKVMEHEP